MKKRHAVAIVVVLVVILMFPLYHAYFFYGTVGLSEFREMETEGFKEGDVIWVWGYVVDNVTYTECLDKFSVHIGADDDPSTTVDMYVNLNEIELNRFEISIIEDVSVGDILKVKYIYHEEYDGYLSQVDWKLCLWHSSFLPPTING